MTRKWTDLRNGKTWEVNIGGQPAIAVPPGYEPGGPPDSDHIRFKGEINGELMQIGTPISGFTDPDEMTDDEIQEHLDRALEELRVGGASDE